MSEYQYYEFVALDGPISDEGMRYAQGCSSRAEVSRFRWTNVYHFGDFHGDAEILLKYYDAHFYIANWGTVRFALWANPISIKGNAAGLKKFYTYLAGIGKVSGDDLAKLREDIKMGMPEWIATVRRYDDPDVDPEDIWQQ